MVILGIINNSTEVVSIAFAHSITNLIYTSLSANARLRILSMMHFDINSQYILRIVVSIIFITILVLFSYLNILKIENIFFFVVIRKSLDWVLELYISDSENNFNNNLIKSYLFIDALSYFYILYSCIFNTNYIIFSFIIWAFIPFVFLFKNFPNLKFKYFEFGKLNYNDFLSTFSIGFVILYQRVFIYLMWGTDVSAKFFVAFAIGGAVSSLVNTILVPSYIKRNKFQLNLNSLNKINKAIKFNILIILVSIILLSFNIIYNVINESVIVSNYYISSVIISIFGSFFMISGGLFKVIYIQVINKNNDLIELLIAFFSIIFITFVGFTYGILGLVFSYLFISLINFIFYTISLKYECKRLIN
jgi:hypothetical protein